MFGAFWAKISSFYLRIGSLIHWGILFFYSKRKTCSAKLTGLQYFFCIYSIYFINTTYASLDYWIWQLIHTKCFVYFISCFQFFAFSFLFSDFSPLWHSYAWIYLYIFTSHLCSFHITYEVKGFFKLWPNLFSFPLQNLLPILRFITLISSFWKFSLKLWNINGCG